MNRVLVYSVVLLLLGLIAWLLAPLFYPATAVYKRSITIKKPQPLIFEQLVSFERWRKWYVSENDSLGIVELKTEGTYSKVNSTFAVLSDNSTITERTLVQTEPYLLIKNNLFFSKKNLHSEEIFKLEKQGDSINTSWEIEVKYPYFVRLNAPVILNSIQDEMGKSLERLKRICDKVPLWKHSEIQLKRLPSQAIYGVKDTVHNNEFPQKSRNAFEELWKFAHEVGVERTGGPLTYYHKYFSDSVIFEVAFPVQKADSAKGRVIGGEIPAGVSLYIEHFGDQQFLRLTHDTVHKFIIENHVKTDFSNWEQYEVDLAQTEEPYLWKTVICYPVEQ